ncbi:hypothetical protein [Deinococcus sp. Arct2-2]|nr:hypothetical protein [Deinococcus sp. Arct2-2]
MAALLEQFSELHRRNNPSPSAPFSALQLFKSALLVQIYSLRLVIKKGTG